MPAKRVSPHPKSRQPPSEVPPIAGSPNSAGPIISRRARPHTTQPRYTKAVPSKLYNPVLGSVGYTRYEYTTNIQQLPLSYFHYRYKSVTRPVADVKTPLQYATEQTSPAVYHPGMKSTKVRRVKTATTRRKPVPSADQEEQEDKPRRLTVQFSDRLATRLVRAQSASPQYSPHISDLLNSPKPITRGSSTRPTLPTESPCKMDNGLLQSSNIIPETALRDLTRQNRQQEPLQSSLLKKSVGTNLCTLNITAVENPSLSTVVKRGAYNLQLARNNALDPECKDLSPFSSIVQFPPPVIKPVHPTANRARSAEVVSASQELDDSLLDLMFVDFRSMEIKMHIWTITLLACVCSRLHHRLPNSTLYLGKNHSLHSPYGWRNDTHIIYGEDFDCPENCSKCSTPLVCEVCEHGYTLTGRGRCVNLCIQGSAATNCATGYCTAFDDTLCSKCAHPDDVPAAGICNTGVTTCTKNSDGVCIACAKDHLLYSGGCYPGKGALALSVCSRDHQFSLDGKVYCSQCANSDEAPIDGHCTSVFSSYCNAQNGQCTDCLEDDYFLYNGGCYNILSSPGDAICTETQDGECVECGSHYPMTDGVCTYCPIDNCLVCENDKCVQCQEGFVLRGSGRCIRLCTEGNGLQSCATGYCTAFGGTLCSKCAYDQDLPISGICSSGLTTCQKDSSNVCISCEEDHLLYQGGCYALTSSLGLQICALKDQIQIGGKTYCKKCKQDGEAPINGVCTSQASEHCSVSGGVCKKCTTTGYFPFQGGCYTLASIPGNIICAEVSDTTCTKCRDGYGLQNNECAPCEVENCLECTSDIKDCEACDPRFFFTGDVCEACEGPHCAACRNDMCIDCTGKTECNACSIPNCMLCDPSTNECLACNDAYESNEDGHCVPLPESECPDSCVCGNLNVPALCTECKPGYIATGVISGESCISCEQEIENCHDCMYVPSSDSLLCTVCKDGYRMGNRRCEKCGQGCKSCPQRANKCEECFEKTPYLNPSLTECLAVCPVNSVATANKQCICAHGYYSTLQGCEPCDASCDTCSGGEIDKCVTCRPGFFLASGSWKGQCLSCNANAFAGGSVIGVENCSKCKGIQQLGNLIVVCAECDPGYTLKEGTCLLDDSGHQDCPLNCMCTDDSPDCIECRKGYYTTTVPSAENCMRCSTTIQNCKVCAVEEESSLWDGKSVVCTACDDGAGLSEGKCHSCHVTCKTCDNSPQLCSACNNPRYKLSLRSDQCVPACPEFSEEQNGRCVCLLGYSISANGMTCVKDISGCPSICTCATGNLCTGCREGYFTFDPSASDSSRCESCNGDFCSSCGSIHSEETILKRRPLRRYRSATDVTNICISCDDRRGCKACSIEGCNKCSVTAPNECLECMPDYQLSITKKVCTPLVPICPLGCTCTPGTDKCNGCANGYFEIDPSSETRDRCMRCNVPTRYIAKSVSQARRMRRSLQLRNTKVSRIQLQPSQNADWDGVAGCSQCKAPSSPGPAICTECVDGKSLVVLGENTKCVDKCPNGMGSINNVCFSCTDQNCLRCDNDLSICTECRVGAVLTSDSESGNIVCNEICPLGCRCDDTESLNVCTGCQDGYYETSVFYKFTMRLRNTNTYCKKCAEKCATCTDGEKCLSCLNGYLLHQNGTTCVTKCEQGYYNNQGKCARCSIDNCTACTSAAICISCVEGTFLSNSQCFKCNSSCKKCNGGTAEDCLACPAGTVHSTGKGLGKCIKECSSDAAGNCVLCNAVIDGTKYCAKCSPQEAPINGKCEPVSNTRTAVCVTTGDGTCTSCSSGYFLFNGGCYETTRYPGSAVCNTASNGLCTSCADGFINSNGICSNCMLGCSSCSSSAASACTTCAEGYFATFTGIQGTCKKCDDTTITNGFQGVSNCRICIAPQQSGQATCLEFNNEGETSNRSSLSTGAITGISIAVIAVVGSIVGVLVWFLCCRRSKAV